MASSPLAPALLERLRAVAQSEGARGAATLRALVGGLHSHEETALEPGREATSAQQAFGIAAIDAMLQQAGGLPRGVVELAAPEGLARATQLALRACAVAQRSSCISGWGRPRERAACIDCAWLDPSRSLYAPGVAQQCVDLSRLLLLQPKPEDVARAAVRLTSSGLFSRIVVDRAGVPGASFASPHIRWNIAVRRLALAAESHETTILLLSGIEQARRDALPVAMRIELTRPHVDQLALRIVKERRGRLPPPCVLPLSALAPQDFRARVGESLSRESGEPLHRESGEPHRESGEPLHREEAAVEARRLVS